MFNKMKRINNKKCCMKLNNLLLFVLVCVWMWGCTELTDGEIEWSNNYNNSNVVGFVDDSLVIVYSYLSWYQDMGSFVHDHGERNGIGKQRLCLYNYRIQEDGPRFCDALDNYDVKDFNYVRGQLTDSIIWGNRGIYEDIEMNLREFSFWKFGNKPKLKSFKVKKDGCKSVFYIESLKPWIRNQIFLKGPLNASDDSCQYAILDTNAKTLTYKRLEEDLKWIEKCDDVRAWGESVYCLSWNKWNKDGEIKKDDVKINVHFDFGIGNFWGDMIELNGNFCKLHDEVLSCHDVTWHGTLEFYKDDEIIVKID